MRLPSGRGLTRVPVCVYSNEDTLSLYCDDLPEPAEREERIVDNNSLQILIAMVCYMAVVIGIGLYFAKRANQNSENYFIGGRTLGPWIAA